MNKKKEAYKNNFFYLLSVKTEVIDQLSPSRQR